MYLKQKVNAHPIRTMKKKTTRKIRRTRLALDVLLSNDDIDVVYSDNAAKCQDGKLIKEFVGSKRYSQVATSSQLGYAKKISLSSRNVDNNLNLSPYKASQRLKVIQTVESSGKKECSSHNAVTTKNFREVNLPVTDAPSRGAVDQPSVLVHSDSGQRSPDQSLSKTPCQERTPPVTADSAEEPRTSDRTAKDSPYESSDTCAHLEDVSLAKQESLDPDVLTENTGTTVSDREKLEFYRTITRWDHSGIGTCADEYYLDRDKKILDAVVTNHERMRLASRLLSNRQANLASTYNSIDNYTGSKRPIPNCTIVALDCEMVGVGPRGSRSEIGRVSIVGFGGEILMDEYGKPRRSVSDYRTKYSGIYPHHLANADSSQDVVRRARCLLKDKIIVGHDLSQDFKVLGICPRIVHVRDTSLYEPYVKVFGKRPSLKALTLLILGQSIQVGPHDSVEDARAAMMLYRAVKPSWEALGLNALFITPKKDKSSKANKKNKTKVPATQLLDDIKTA